MSIKPVDFQISIPRAVEASKVRGDENNKELAQQHAQAGSIQHKADNTMKQVQKRNQAEEARIREKQEKEESKRQGKGQEEEEKDNKDKNNGNYVTKQKTSTFDVKI
ncbi:MAG: hypothetical protein ACM3KR_03810 [Deltaproteobacteria bacterium]